MQKEEISEEIKDSIQESTDALDKSTLETESETEVESETEAKAEQAYPNYLPPKPPSILKILGLAVLVVSLVGSILMNLSFISLSDENTSATPMFYWVVIIGVLLIAAVSLGISFWLYYVRSIYLKDGPALVPEKWGVLLGELSNLTNQSRINTIEKLTRVINASSHQASKSEALLESFLMLQQTISNRDEEISRLKKGHDSKIFKRFITRFVRVSISLEEIREEAKESDQAKNYKYLCKKIQNALEECGVEQLYPEIGLDYREFGSEMDDDPKVIETDDVSKNFQIASVELPAYIFKGEGDREIIIPSKVTIYKTLTEGVAEK